VEQLKAGLDVIQGTEYPNFLSAFVRPLLQVMPVIASCASNGAEYQSPCSQFSMQVVTLSCLSVDPSMYVEPANCRCSWQRLFNMGRQSSRSFAT
jgi:hypothetical protein